ncbi:MAG: hypothetical protein FJZ47_14340 [Candidatus Tectomicrobia bacterium]|uniref:Uncharacterized protein n=1 Tax=Tectimicrobiota bacterium TaxID=2528274 RepID=A0A937W4C8_UNCTE|nr:hypothetical protein [Candidatus Tectomicrobia bacterium]
MSTPDVVVNVLQHLVALPDICLVLGPGEAVCETFVDPATMDFRVEGEFVTMENGPWHIHLNATKIHQIAFVVTPDTVHGNGNQMSYSVRFLDAQGNALLRAFFLAMYDAHGQVATTRVQQYDALRTRGGDNAVV